MFAIKTYNIEINTHPYYLNMVQQNKIKFSF